MRPIVFFDRKSRFENTIPFIIPVTKEAFAQAAWPSEEIDDRDWVHAHPRQPARRCGVFPGGSVAKILSESVASSLHPVWLSDMAAADGALQIPDGRTTAPRCSDRIEPVARCSCLSVSAGTQRAAEKLFDPR